MGKIANSLMLDITINGPMNDINLMIEFEIWLFDLKDILRKIHDIVFSQCLQFGKKNRTLWHTLTNLLENSNLGR